MYVVDHIIQYQIVPYSKTTWKKDETRKPRLSSLWYHWTLANLFSRTLTSQYKIIWITVESYHPSIHYLVSSVHFILEINIVEILTLISFATTMDLMHCNECFWFVRFPNSHLGIKFTGYNVQVMVMGSSAWFLQQILRLKTKRITIFIPMSNRKTHKRCYVGGQGQHIPSKFHIPN